MPNYGLCCSSLLQVAKQSAKKSMSVEVRPGLIIAPKTFASKVIVWSVVSLGTLCSLFQISQLRASPESQYASGDDVVAEANVAEANTEANKDTYSADTASKELVFSALNDQERAVIALALEDLVDQVLFGTSPHLAWPGSLEEVQKLSLAQISHQSTFLGESAVSPGARSALGLSGGIFAGRISVGSSRSGAQAVMSPERALSRGRKNILSRVTRSAMGRTSLVALGAGLLWRLVHKPRSFDQRSPHLRTFRYGYGSQWRGAAFDDPSAPESSAPLSPLEVGSVTNSSQPSDVLLDSDLSDVERLSIASSTFYWVPLLEHLSKLYRNQSLEQSVEHLETWVGASHVFKDFNALSDAEQIELLSRVEDIVIETSSGAELIYRWMIFSLWMTHSPEELSDLLSLLPQQDSKEWCALSVQLAENIVYHLSKKPALRNSILRRIKGAFALCSGQASRYYQNLKPYEYWLYQGVLLARIISQELRR